MIAQVVTAGTLTRGPMAESVTPRSAIISFHTATRDHDSVLLQNGVRIDAGSGVDHVARLTRLTPGKQYTYTLAGTAGALVTGTFRAAPIAAGKFTFAVVGDFGTGSSDETGVASLIASWHPDFVLTVGDNAYPTGSKDVLDRDIFHPYSAVMRASAWFPALGNHDVKADGGKSKLEAFHSLGNERWYRFARSRSHGGVVYVAVGTGGHSLSDDARNLTIPAARIVQGRFGALRVDVAGRQAHFRYETVGGVVRDRFRLSCSYSARTNEERAR